MSLTTTLLPPRPYLQSASNQLLSFDPQAIYNPQSGSLNEAAASKKLSQTLSF
jgi:hypothetical protein